MASMESPVLVSSTDGVGTKLKIAFMMGKHDTIGIDLVAMCVNDIIVQGAKPLFFLDYLSMGKLETKTATDVITGIGEGCRMAKCALIGGETAEMPGFYKDNEYDLAGFVVGLVENNKIIDGSGIHVGDQIIGISSSGLHSNGYSLVRKVCFDVLGLEIDTYVTELGRTIGEELLTPTRIYGYTLRPFTALSKICQFSALPILPAEELQIILFELFRKVVMLSCVKTVGMYRLYLLICRRPAIYLKKK